jgi:hypothetical protein
MRVESGVVDRGIGSGGGRMGDLIVGGEEEERREEAR